MIYADMYRYCGGTMFNNGNCTGAALAGIGSIQVYCVDNGWVGAIPMIGIDTISERIICDSLDTIINSCSNGNCALVGIHRFTAVGTLVLDTSFLGSVQCDNFMFIQQSGARTTTVNLTSQPSCVAYTTYNRADYAENNSIQFNPPNSIPFYKPNQSVTYNWSAHDPDGDSLWWELDTAINSVYSGNFNPVVYSGVSGTSALNPIPGITIDNHTGELEFTASIPTGYNFANYVVAVRVEEYDPISGDFKGESHRDVQFVVAPYAYSNQPVMDNIELLQGGKTIDSLEYEVCLGDTFCFEIQVSDADLGDTIDIVSSIGDFTDYYSIEMTGSNPKVATICGVMNQSYDYWLGASVDFYDSECPLVSHSSVHLKIRTTRSPELDTIFGCYGTWDTLSANTDSLAIWSMISGDSISAINFNCINASCTEVELNPFNTTSYLIENIMTGGCSVFDTLTVLTDPTVLIGQALDTAQNPVTNSKVYRIQFDAGQDSVYAIDSAVTDAAGYFTFSLGIDSFLLKVSPDINTYPLLLPTYYDSKVTVPQADFIYPDYCDTLELTHEVQSGVNLGGPGFIAGIVSQGAGRAVGDPVPGVDIVLMSDEETPIAHTKTDENGEFRFYDLSNGDYLVYVDRWLIQNNLAPMITLTEEYNEVDDLEFILYSNRLELIKPKGISTSDDFKFEVYPNPTHNEVNIVSDKYISYVRLKDVLGSEHRIFSINAKMGTITLDGLASGLYLLEFYTDEELISVKELILN